MLPYGACRVHVLETSSISESFQMSTCFSQRTIYYFYLLGFVCWIFTICPEVWCLHFKKSCSFDIIRRRKRKHLPVWWASIYYSPAFWSPMVIIYWRNGSFTLDLQIVLKLVLPKKDKRAEVILIMLSNTLCSINKSNLLADNAKSLMKAFLKGFSENKPQEGSICCFQLATTRIWIRVRFIQTTGWWTLYLLYPILYWNLCSHSLDDFCNTTGRASVSRQQGWADARATENRRAPYYWC